MPTRSWEEVSSSVDRDSENYQNEKRLAEIRMLDQAHANVLRCEAAIERDSAKSYRKDSMPVSSEESNELYADLHEAKAALLEMQASYVEKWGAGSI